MRAVRGLYAHAGILLASRLRSAKGARLVTLKGSLTALTLTLAVAVAAVSSPASAAPPLRKQVQALATDLDLMRSTVETILKEMERLREGQSDMETELGERLKSLKDQANAAGSTLSRLQSTVERQAVDLRATEERVSFVEKKLEEESDEPGRISKAIRLVADLRIRDELWNNHRDLDADQDDTDARIGHRLRLGFELKPSSYAELTVIAQDARIFGSEESTSSDDEGLGLWRGFMTLKPPLGGGHAMSIRAGRIGLSVGSGIIVGEDDWSFAGRAFDGFHVNYSPGNIIWTELFYALVRERRTPKGADTDLAGLVVGSKAIGAYLEPQVYVLYLHDGKLDGVGERKIATVVVRAEGRPVAGLYYEAEAAFQLGKVRESDGVEVDRMATTYFIHGRYTYEASSVRPEVDVRVYTASGDGNPLDDLDVDFDPLFGDSYSHLDPMGLFRLSNLFLVSVGAKVRPVESLSVEGSLHLAYLSSAQGRVPAFGSQHFPSDEWDTDLGKELHLAMTYYRDSLLELKLGYAAFLPGGAAKQTTGGEDRSDWVYGQARVKF